VILLYNGILYDPAFAGNRRDVGWIVALMHIHRMGQKQNGSTWWLICNLVILVGG
jgi:hypothetical protein